MSATVNVQADSAGESTKIRVLVGAGPKLDRHSCSCSGTLGLLAKQMLRQPNQCDLLRSSCHCMENV